MSDEQEVYTPNTQINTSIYNAVFAKCFSEEYKPQEKQDEGWSALLRVCVQRHFDSFNIAAASHENKPSFKVPSFAQEEEEEEEDDE